MSEFGAAYVKIFLNIFKKFDVVSAVSRELFLLNYGQGKCSKNVFSKLINRQNNIKGLSLYVLRK